MLIEFSFEQYVYVHFNINHKCPNLLIVSIVSILWKLRMMFDVSYFGRIVLNTSNDLRAQNLEANKANRKPNKNNKDQWKEQC